jgi:hypothetical protein
MTIAVAEKLLAAGHSVLDHLMTDTGRRFVTWSTSENITVHQAGPPWKAAASLPPVCPGVKCQSR